MAEEKTTLMTQSGYDEKLKDLQYRENEKRNAISDQIKYAKSLGDFSENAELDAAKLEENENEMTILKLKHELETAKIITATKYTIHDYQDDEDCVYTLVGGAEASILDNRISLDSPLGIAVRGHKVGDTVIVKTSATDNYKIKILDIEKE